GSTVDNQSRATTTPRPHTHLRGSQTGPLCRDQLPNGRNDLRCEPAEVIRIVADGEVRAHPVRQRQLRQLLDPDRRRSIEEAGSGAVERSTDVVKPPYRGRVPPSGLRRFVDDGVALGEGLGPGVRAARQPTIAHAADHVEHPRFRATDPDLYRMCRGAARLGTHHAVVLPFNPSPLPDVPQCTDDRNALLEGLHGLARTQSPTTHRCDRIPEGAGTDAELDPAGA